EQDCPLIRAELPPRVADHRAVSVSERTVELDRGQDRLAGRRLDADHDGVVEATLPQESIGLVRRTGGQRILAHHPQVHRIGELELLQCQALSLVDPDGRRAREIAWAPVAFAELLASGVDAVATRNRQHSEQQQNALFWCTAQGGRAQWLCRQTFSSS